MKVVFYSTNCPKCNVLKTKLDQKGVDYETSYDIQPVIDHGFMSAPVLQIGDEWLDFSSAIKRVKEGI